MTSLYKSFAVIFLTSFHMPILLAQSTALPPLGSYFQENDLEHITGPSHSSHCPESAAIRLEDRGDKDPVAVIDRMPIEDGSCVPVPRQPKRYKLNKRFSGCGKVVYVDQAAQSIQDAQFVIIDNRTGTCDDSSHAQRAEVVIRENSGKKAADFFVIR